MKFDYKTTLYKPDSHPSNGKHILAQTSNGDHLIVYQAYKKSIAEYAVKHQKLGGPDFSFNRMSWIKPNFLWMMYRCGWATKLGQEHVLALWIPQRFFDQILENAISSSFSSDQHVNIEAWRRELEQKDVRLQWDPDHDPYGKPVERRAIQLGLKGHFLKEFATHEVAQISDITPFVREQSKFVDVRDLGRLIVPAEEVYVPHSFGLSSKIGLDSIL